MAWQHPEASEMAPDERIRRFTAPDRGMNGGMIRSGFFKRWPSRAHILDIWGLVDYIDYMYLEDKRTISASTRFEAKSLGGF